MRLTETFAVLLLVLLFLPGGQALAEAQYSFDVSAAGESSATVVINTTQVTILPLPEDVHNPQVEGATFTLVNDGIEILPSNEIVQVTYTSSYHTSKQEGVWTFIAEVLPMSEVDISLPLDTQVIRTKPRAALSEDRGLSAHWALTDDEILISYVIPLKEQQLLRAGPVVVERFSLVSFEGAVFVLILAGGITWWILRRKKREQSTPKKEPPAEVTAAEEPSPKSGPIPTHDIDKDLPQITDAQMHVLRAANDNEATVLKIMLKHHGHLKRNELERESGISKSSLASALKNLEGKNIIHIDRSFFVHYLTLSDWFKGLK